MDQDGNGNGETPLEKGIRCLNSRIQPVPLVFMILAVGMLMQLGVQSSNEKKIHEVTVFCAFGNLVSWVFLFGLVYFRNPTPSHHRPGWYIVIKVFLHACALLLVSLSFSLSLMMSMSVLAAYSTLAMAAAMVAHRLRQCMKTTLETDVSEYMGCEEVIHQLIELSTTAASFLLAGWYGMAFFYFQNYPKEAGDERLLPSEYLTFFTSVAASLMLVKAVPRRLGLFPRLVWEWEPVVLIGALFILMVGTALVIAVSKVGRYAALALVPEAVALVFWFVQWATDMWDMSPARFREYIHGVGQGEPLPLNFVAVALALLMPVLSYRIKDVKALSTLYDEVLVVVTAAAVVAVLSGWLLTQTQRLGLKGAARILEYFAFGLMLLSVLALPGVWFGW